MPIKWDHYYWDNIQGYEPRGVCAHCGTTESMGHILLECSCPGQVKIWELAEYGKNKEQVGLNLPSEPYLHVEQQTSQIRKGRQIPGKHGCTGYLHISYGN